MTGTRWPSFITALQPQLSESLVRAELPSALSIGTPAAELTESLKAISGVWQGWGGAGRCFDVRVVVSLVSAESATVHFCAAGSDGSGVTHRLICAFEGEEIVAFTDEGARVAFRLRSVDTSEFLWNFRDGGWMCGVLAKTDPDSMHSIERIPAPGSSGSLEAHVFRPVGTGPFPTVIFNHGSTGDGTDASLFNDTWACLPLARVFTELGWLVVFPQRRGRGKSDGLYDEGFKSSRKGYSTRASKALAGVDHALEDVAACLAWTSQHADIDIQRLIIGGQSRGGALSIAAAGEHPDVFRGAISFVGGWLGDQASSAETVNATTFERGAAFGGATLWFCAEADPYYTVAHSRFNFDRFTAAGGRGTLHVIDAGPSIDSHQIVFEPSLWKQSLEGYLRSIKAE